MTHQEMTFEIKSQKIEKNGRVKIYLNNGETEEVVLAKDEVCFTKDRHGEIIESWLEVRRHYIAGLNPALFKSFPVPIQDIYKIVSTPLKSMKQSSVTSVFALDTYGKGLR